MEKLCSPDPPDLFSGKGGSFAKPPEAVIPMKIGIQTHAIAIAPSVAAMDPAFRQDGGKEIGLLRDGRFYWGTMPSIRRVAGASLTRIGGACAAVLFAFVAWVARHCRFGGASVTRRWRVGAASVCAFGRLGLRGHAFPLNLSGVYARNPNPPKPALARANKSVPTQPASCHGSRMHSHRQTAPFRQGVTYARVCACARGRDFCDFMNGIWRDAR